MNQQQYQRASGLRRSAVVAVLAAAVLADSASAQAQEKGGDGPRMKTPSTQFILPRLNSPLPAIDKSAPEELRAAYQLAADWTHFDHMQGVHYRRLLLIAEARATAPGARRTEPDFLKRHLSVANRVGTDLLAALDRADKLPGAEPIDVQYLRAEVLRWRVEYAFMNAAIELDQALAEGRDTELSDRALSSLNYGQAIALWERLVRDYPDHPSHPNTLYHLAYHRHHDGDDPAAVHALRLLLCPETATEPRYRACRPLPSGAQGHARDAYHALHAYAWILLGDIHFDTIGQLPAAAAAYARAASDIRLPVQVAAVYKRAWSLYRMDDYPGAIAGFDQLLRLARNTGQTGSAAEVAESARQVRAEAVQYMAIAFVDTWQLGDQMTDQVTGTRPSPSALAERYFGDRRHSIEARDVFAALGDVLADMMAWPQAGEAWERALAIAPKHPDAARLRRVIGEARQRK